MSDERKARVEVVVRIVKDDPDKPQAEGAPEFRRVLHEIAVPIRSEFDWLSGPPPGMSPQEVMGMSDAEMMQQVAAPMIDEMAKLPLPMMLVQCVQGLMEKLRARSKLVGRVSE